MLSNNLCVSGKVKAATGVKHHAKNEYEGVKIKFILNLIFRQVARAGPFPHWTRYCIDLRACLGMIVMRSSRSLFIDSSPFCKHKGLTSWVKRDQLDVICFIISLFNAQHVSDVNTAILRSLRLMCWVISWVVLLWFDVVSICRLRHWCLSLHMDTTPPQPNHNVTPTHIEAEQYNPWNNSAHKP